MSRLIQSIVVTIALVAGATAHARTSTYEFFGNFDSYEFAYWNTSSARFEIKVSSTDYGSPVKLERLEIYPFDPYSGSPTCGGGSRCLPRFVATGFRNLDPPNYYSGRHQATIKNWSFFSYVDANVELGADGSLWRVMLVAHDQPGPIDLYDPYADQAFLSLLEFSPNSHKDISPSNTVDTATIKLDGKRLTMKLQDRLGRASGDQQERLSFVIDTLWMGHGHTKLYIPSWWDWPSHQREVYALNVETISGPTGDQIILSVSYREYEPGGGSYEQISESLDLRVLLEQAFGPSP